MNTTIRSVGAVFAGLVFIAITHTATDAILENLGVLPKGHLNVGTGLIVLVIAYRFVLSIAGSYIAARLSPAGPMKHALILGCIGLVLSAAGALATANMDLSPWWYAWSLVIIALPAAYIGGWSYIASVSRHIWR